MSLAVKPKQLKLLVAAAAILGLALRFALYATGVDEKGLLVSCHWADTAVWLLTAAVVAIIFFCCRGITGPKRYQYAFPASFTSAAGSILAGVGFALCGAPEAAEGNLALAEIVLRFVAAGSLLAVGYCRFTGKKPSFLLHTAVCLYLALRLVCQYRLWSTDTQLQNYGFFLGAYVTLMLTAYQLAAFDADLGNHRLLWSWGLAAAYLCILSLAGSGEAFFLLCCGIWVVTNLSNLARRRKPAATGDGDEHVPS